MKKRTMLNDALRLLRLYCGYSQTEMANRISVSQSMISDIESCRKNVTMDLLEAYSKGVGIRMSQLLFFAEEIKEKPITKRGRLIIAEHVLKILEKLKPSDNELTSK